MSCLQCFHEVLHTKYIDAHLDVYVLGNTSPVLNPPEIYDISILLCTTFRRNCASINSADFMGQVIVWTKQGLGEPYSLI